MSHGFLCTISTHRSSCFYSVSQIATSRLTPKQEAALLQFWHEQLRATTGCCNTPYQKHCNLLVTFTTFSVNHLPFMLSIHWQALWQRAFKERIQGFVVIRATQDHKKVGVHHCANIQGGRQIPCQCCVFNKHTQLMSKKSIFFDKFVGHCKKVYMNVWSKP